MLKKCFFKRDKESIFIWKHFISDLIYVKFIIANEAVPSCVLHIYVNMNILKIEQKKIMRAINISTVYL